MRWKQELPQASKTELLRQTLLVRMESYRTLGLKPLSEEEQIELLKRANGEVRKLILLVVHNENPEASEALVTAPEAYRDMLEVINEVVDKYELKAQRL